jgi:RimJ/RimL family protein N-acetyltransferase
MVSNPLEMPPLETERLVIRPFAMDDLPAIHAILNACFGESTLDERREWLEWAVRNPAALARLGQPPYGDRAILLKRNGALIGSVGLVPAYGPFDTLPNFRQRSTAAASGLYTPEMGLFWAVDPAQRGQSYATEAAAALIRFAFGQLSLKRIIATTEYDNAASIGVMRRLGMTIERNPNPQPAWFQIVGILANPQASTAG